MATLTVHGSEIVTEETELKKSLDRSPTFASYTLLGRVPDTILTPKSVTRTSNPGTMPLNKVGDRTEPCGTPLGMFFVFEDLPL